MLRGKRIVPNIRDVVYIAGVRFGGETEWNYCWETFRKTQVPSEKRLMLQALGASTDPWLLQRYLLKTLDRENVKSQDVEAVISAVARNPEGRSLAWRHLKAYWPQFHALFGNGSLTMGTLISTVVSEFFTEYDYQEVHPTYRKYNFPEFLALLKFFKLNIFQVTAELIQNFANFLRRQSSSVT